jgi:hypothetical protein
MPGPNNEQCETCYYGQPLVDEYTAGWDPKTICCLAPSKPVHNPDSWCSIYKDRTLWIKLKRWWSIWRS